MPERDERENSPGNETAPGEGAQADITGSEGNAPEQLNHTLPVATRQGSPVPCPSCGALAEPCGNQWLCGACNTLFDEAELTSHGNGRRPPRERIDTDNLKARVALSAIFEAHGVALDGAGMGRCPWHADNTPSLHVNDEAGYLKCHGCDARGDHLSAIQRFDGSDFKTALAELQRMAGKVQKPPAPRAPKPGRPRPRFPVPDSAAPALNEKLAHGKLKDGDKWVFIHEKYGLAVAGWRWHDRDGNWMFSTARHERDSRKSVLPYYFGEDDKWHLGDALSESRPLFRLHDVVTSELPVLVVEGEKCGSVDVPGFVVTTWRGGTGAVAQTDFSPLEERSVTIWPDADEPGVAAALKIRERLPHARILRIEGKPKGWDCADAAADGMDLAAFISGCPVIAPEPGAPADAPPQQAASKGARKSREPFAATVLLEKLFETDALLFHDGDETFCSFGANGHTETAPLRSRHFRRHLSWLYFAALGSAPSGKAIEEALGVLDANARHKRRLPRRYHQ